MMTDLAAANDAAEVKENPAKTCLNQLLLHGTALVYLLGH